MPVGGHRQRQRLQTTGRTALGRLTPRYRWRRIAEIDRLIGMDLRPEGFVLVLQGAQPPRQMPITGIEHDIGKTKPLPPQAMDQGQRPLALAAKLSPVNAYPYTQLIWR